MLLAKTQGLILISGGILIGSNCFLYNTVGKKQSVHLNRVQGSSVGRRARGKAVNFIWNEDFGVFQDLHRL